MLAINRKRITRDVTATIEIFNTVDTSMVNNFKQIDTDTSTCFSCVHTTWVVLGFSHFSFTFTNKVGDFWLKSGNFHDLAEKSSDNHIPRNWYACNL